MTQPGRRWYPPGHWVEDATCHQLGPVAWDQAAPPEQAEHCSTCPVLDHCHQWASDYLWHGVTIAGWRAPPDRPAPVPPTRRNRARRGEHGNHSQ